MKEQLLKPCPFCGGEAEIKTSVRPDTYDYYTVKYIECKSCGCRTLDYICDGTYDQHYSDENIAAIWNHRYSPEKSSNIIDFGEKKIRRTLDNKNSTISDIFETFTSDQKLLTYTIIGTILEEQPHVKIIDIQTGKLNLSEKDSEVYETLDPVQKQLLDMLISNALSLQKIDN